MKVSFFQSLPKHNNILQNLDSIKLMIETHKKRINGTQLLVFPEYFLTGPLNLESFEIYKKQTLEIDISGEFSKISESFPDTTIIFGSIILPRENLYLNNSLVYQNGFKIGEYNKKALIYNENYICKATNSYPIFEVNGIRIGIAICWDLILPEVFRHYVKKADLVVIPSFWGIGGNALQAKYSFSLEKKYYRALCTTRAYENSFAILFVNSVGKYVSNFYSDRMMGGSLAVMPPLGEIYFTNDKKPNSLHVIDFNFDLLKEYREFYATDKDFKFYQTQKIF